MTLRRIVFAATFGIGATGFAFRLLSRDWSSDPLAALGPAVAALLLAAAALGGWLAKGFPQHGGRWLTPLLTCTAIVEVVAVCAFVALARPDVTPAADAWLAVAVGAAAVAWVAWSVSTWREAARRRASADADAGADA